MDIFGTIKSTIDLSQQIYDYLQAVKDADNERSKLGAEVSVLVALLKILRDGISDPTDRNGLIQTGIQPALKQCHSALQFIDSKLKVLQPGSSRLDKLVKKLEWPFCRDEIQETLKKIERLKTLISLSLQTSLKNFVEAIREDLANVDVNVHELNLKISKLEKNQTDHIRQTESYIDEKKLQEITDWLSQLDFDQKQDNIRSVYTNETGNWLIDNPIFKSWLHGEFNTLWCPGNAGVGKTIILSFIIRHLQEQFQSDDNVAVTFLFLDYKAHSGVSALQLVESLFKQLIRLGRHTMRKSKSLDELEKFKTKGMRPKRDELLTLLKAQINTFSTVIIAVDALDELPIITRDQLLADLRNLYSSNIRLIATSRKPFDIPNGFINDKCLEVVADPESMKRYIKHRISESTNLRNLLDNHQRLHDELIDKVVQKADGMFLLVRLHMDSLEIQLTRKALRKTLNELPKERKTTYDEAMKRISPSDKEIAYEIFSWLVRAKRPLRLIDLQYALAVPEAVKEGMTEVDDDDLPPESFISRFAGLVILQPGAHNHGNKQIVGLVHYTAQEYFLDNHDVISMLPHPVHLAMTCLQYLHFDVFNRPTTNLDDREKLRDIPFVNYVALHWGDHAREHLNNINIPGLTTRFLEDNRRAEAAGVLKTKATSDYHALQLCAIFGLLDHFATLLSDGADVNAKDSDGDTALTNASIYGQDSIVKFLLARNDTDINPRGWGGMTPLGRAADEGHESTIKIMLEFSAVDVNSKDLDGRTPLSVAAAWGHEGVVKLLLEKGVDIESKDLDGHTALALAAINGHDKVLRLIMDAEKQRVDIESKDVKGCTPFSSAAECGREEDVKLLLQQQGIDIEPKDTTGCTPLALAAFFGHEEVVRILAMRGAEVESKAANGCTPLGLAALSGHAEVVKLLMEKQGVDIESKDAGGRTPLALAAEWGHHDVVSVLLASKAVEIDSKTNDGNTPLSLAAGGGHKAVVELLMRKEGVDVNVKNVLGNTPLARAAINGHDDVVKLLITKEGIDFHSKNAKGQTALEIARENGNISIAQLLEFTGASIGTENVS